LIIWIYMRIMDVIDQVGEMKCGYKVFWATNIFHKSIQRIGIMRVQESTITNLKWWMKQGVALNGHSKTRDMNRSCCDSSRRQYRQWISTTQWDDGGGGQAFWWYGFVSKYATPIDPMAYHHFPYWKIDCHGNFVSPIGLPPQVFKGGVIKKGSDYGGVGGVPVGNDLQLGKIGL
jgi:hypothetical protein